MDNNYFRCNTICVCIGIGTTSAGDTIAITSTGNVGIGSTGPTARLQVVGADSLNTSFAANIAGATGTGLIVTNSGNVGIGTTGPLAKLDVNGTVAATKFTDGGSGYDFFMPNPACPDEEMLCHWAIETDGLKTIYSGNAETDDSAECIVQMPSWFLPLNDISTCTYSLTSLSGLGQVAVKEKMSPAGAFVVVSEYPRQEFSWTVIVYRGDPIGARTMRENPIVEKKR